MFHISIGYLFHMSRLIIFWSDTNQSGWSLLRWTCESSFFLAFFGFFKHYCRQDSWRETGSGRNEPGAAAVRKNSLYKGDTCSKNWAIQRPEIPVLKISAVQLPWKVILEHIEWILTCKLDVTKLAHLKYNNSILWTSEVMLTGWLVIAEAVTA